MKLDLDCQNGFANGIAFRFEWNCCQPLKLFRIKKLVPTTIVQSDCCDLRLAVEDVGLRGGVTEDVGLTRGGVLEEALGGENFFSG